jgi:hypothetical protein
MHESIIVPFTDNPGIVYGLFVLVICWNGAVAVVCPKNINVLLKQKCLGVDNIFFTEHPNMLVNGIPNKDLLQPDGIHLNDKGISLLAGNIKRAIHIALDIPPPPRRSRSKSPGRRGRRQYQNYP